MESFKKAAQEQIEALNSSAFCLQLFHENMLTDPFPLMHMGQVVMTDKPLIVLAREEDTIPPKLRLIADEILILTHEEFSDKGFADSAQAKLTEAMKKLKVGPYNDGTT